jgi:hypothetical protein
MPELPTCECIGGFPPYDRLTFIYQAAAELSGDESLPSADCVAGVPPFSRFAYIYAAFRVLAEDDSLPSQECVEGEPFQDQVTRIYQAVFAYAGDAGLPDVDCVRGTPMWQQWVNIYAALYSAAGEPDELTDPLCINSTFDVLSEVFCAIIYLIENANPIVLSAVILEDGSTVQITFNQAVTGTTGFFFTVDGVERSFTYQSGDGTAVYEYLLDDAPIVEGEVVLMDYTPGGIVSVATGNPLEAFTDFSVTNPFDVFYYLRPDGVSRYLRPDGVSFYLRP